MFAYNTVSFNFVISLWHYELTMPVLMSHS